MRITGGTLKGRMIQAPRGLSVRPTSGRARQAIFNMVGQHLAGRRVLDLFAGSGILGIEALSRGAERALFVESGTAAATVLARNLARLGLEERGAVWRKDVFQALRRTGVPGGPAVDVVFADPPYSEGMGPAVLAALVDNRWLASGAVVVLDHARGQRLGEPPAGLTIHRERSYGRTAVTIFLYQKTEE